MTQSERDLFTFFNGLLDGLHPPARLWDRCARATSVRRGRLHRAPPTARLHCDAAAVSAVVGRILGAVATHHAAPAPASSSIWLMSVRRSRTFRWP
jgi:hypothetical protein